MPNSRGKVVNLLSTRLAPCLECVDHLTSRVWHNWPVHLIIYFFNHPKLPNNSGSHLQDEIKCTTIFTKCFFFLIFGGLSSILWDHWLPLFWTSCNPPPHALLLARARLTYRFTSGTTTAFSTTHLYSIFWLAFWFGVFMDCNLPLDGKFLKLKKSS